MLTDGHFTLAVRSLIDPHISLKNSSTCRPNRASNHSSHFENFVDTFKTNRTPGSFLGKRKRIHSASAAAEEASSEESFGSVYSDFDLTTPIRLWLEEVEAQHFGTARGGGVDDTGVHAEADDNPDDLPYTEVELEDSCELIDDEDTSDGRRADDTGEKVSLAFLPRSTVPKLDGWICSCFISYLTENGFFRIQLFIRR